LNWKPWLHSLIATFVAGAANAITLVIVDPVAFNGDWKRIGLVALVSGLVAAAFYLKKSPLPEEKQ
jgi:hypothetical protein